MKKTGLILLLLLCGIYFPSFGAVFSAQEQMTIDKIKNSFLNRIKEEKQTVKVAIGNQNFSNYLWEKVSIYGTKEFEVYNDKTYIASYEEENPVNISMVGKIFVLTDSEDNVIAKVSGPIVFKSDFGLIGIKNLKRGGKNALYRGNIELVCPKEGYFNIVNSLDVEEYLKGVVPNEMPIHFGLEALKAQSVAARNYVLSPRVKASPNYDVVDSVASQVYFGANTEKELSNRAVEETKGIVALYDWDLILALYSSTAGGYTESYENAFSDPKTKAFPANPKPYLKGVPDYDDFADLNIEENAYDFYTSKPKSFDNKSSYYRWEREWTQEELQQEIQNHIASQSDAGFVYPVVKKGEIIGQITGLRVLKRGLSGKIMQIEIQTENQNYIATKELVIRRLFTVKGKALPSANFVIKQEYDEEDNLKNIKIYGGGYGHGVGMSQFGAGYMAAELKKNFEQILKHYYCGITLGTEPFELTGNLNTKTQTFYTKNGQAFLVVNNKNKAEYVDAIFNGIYEAIKLDKNKNINRIDISKYLQKGLNTVTFNYPTYSGSNVRIKLYIEIAGQDEYSDK